MARSSLSFALRRPGVRHAALRRAARNGRAIVLIWHRVAPHGAEEHEVVRTVPTAEFTAQLELLAELGEIVSLADVDRGGPSARPRFALTFDDDDPRHARHVLPIIVERGLPATFFLSGRWQRGWGPYWWDVLEERIRVSGRAAVAEDLGLPENATPPEMAASITGTDRARELAGEGRRAASPVMRAADAAQLVAAGMEIGFHTADHQVLPLLDDEELGDALTDGRAALEAELGVEVRRFAYPHGRTDERVALAARAAYASAWTTTKRVVVDTEPPMLRGRWDLGHLPVDTIRSRLLTGLTKPVR